MSSAYWLSELENINVAVGRRHQAYSRTMVVMQYSRCPIKFFIWILITLLNTFASSVAASLGDALVNVTFSPPYLDQLKDGSNRTIWIRITYQHHRLDGKYAFEIRNNNTLASTAKVQSFGSASPPPPPPAVAFNFKVDDGSIARVIDPPVALHQRRIASFHRAMIANGTNSSADGEGDDDDDDNLWSLETSFTVKGLFLGKTKIEIQIYALTEEEAKNAKSDSITMDEPISDDRPKNEYTYAVSVVRHDKKLAHTFVGTLMILLIVANVLMGSQLNLNVVFEVIKKPFAPAIGFICQFLVMPVISYTLARIFFVPVGLYNLGLGLFTTGCCPGGGASNAYTVLLDGNVDLSITMTFLSTLLSLAMMPLWMFALGRQFLVEQPGQRISIPYNNIVYSMLMLVLPLCAGVMLRRFWPKFVDHGKKVLRPFLGLIIVFICTFGVYANLYMFRLMTWRVLVGGLGLPWLGFAFGLIISALARQPKANVVAISIETGIQNTGIAIMLLQLSFTQPDADLAAVLPVVVAMFTPAPMILALTVHYVIKWRIEAKKKQQANIWGDKAMVVLSDQKECDPEQPQTIPATGDESCCCLQSGDAEAEHNEVYGGGVEEQKGDKCDEAKQMLEV